jgi:hypothetical protein
MAPSARRRSSRRFTSLEALPAEDRPALSRAEGDCGFASALGADGRGFYATGRAAAFRSPVLPFGFAVFAAPRLILKIFFVIKLLLTRGKDEIFPAVDALENPILKFGHGTILESKDKADAFASPVKKGKRALCVAPAIPGW